MKAFPFTLADSVTRSTLAGLRRMLVCLSLVTALCGARADDKSEADDNPSEREIALLRIQFERNWIATSLAAVKKQVAVVEALEKRLAEARDYDGAIAARQQHQQWQAELLRLSQDLELLQAREHTLTSPLPHPRILLPLDNAILAGVSRRNGMLTDWAKPGASAMWKLPPLPPGGYEVRLRYRCGPLEGGSITAKEDIFTLSGPVETTMRGPESRNLGTLRLSEGASSLTLTANSVMKDNLMQLLEVELIPATD